MTFEYVDPLLSELRKHGPIRARRKYQESPPTGRAPYEAVTPVLLHNWLDISVTFQLQTPWFSKDDVPFHVLDNPVHRDRVFGAPFMSASSWKGLLRWAARMKSEPGLLTHLEQNENNLSDWKDSKEVVHLFGNQRHFHNERDSGNEREEAEHAAEQHAVQDRLEQVDVEDHVHGFKARCRRGESPRWRGGLRFCRRA